MLIYRGRRYLKSNSPASVITNSSPCSHHLSVQSVTLSQWPSQGLICDHLHLLYLLVSLQLYMAKYRLLGQVSSASNTASSGTGSSRGWDQGSGASHPGRSSGCGSRVNSGQYSPMSISSSCLSSRSPKHAQEPLCGQPLVRSGLMPHKFSVWPLYH